MRTLHVLLLAAALGACRPPPVPPPPPPRGAAIESPRVAVLAFRLGDQIDPTRVPQDLGAEIARALAVRLAAVGVASVEPARVLGATELSDTGAYGPPLGARVARKVEANVAVVGVLTRFRERVGTDWSVETPASAAYEASLVRASDGATLATDRFDYTQQTLTSNLLDLPRFLRGGGKWLTGRALLDGALEETAGRFATTLGVARPAR